MPVVEQVIDPVFLRLDGVIDGAEAGYKEVRYSQLDATGGPLVGTYLSGHLNRRFLCEL